jgi:hypothetical protein
VAARLNLGGAFVSVIPDPAYGWLAMVLVAPSRAIALQRLADETSEKLRTMYDLKPVKR